jgi:hypothetical protein
MLQRAVLQELGHPLYRLPPAQVRDVAMLQRLALAAGQPEDVLLTHPDVVAAVDGLHANPVAKRALWPLLRALRR